MKRYYTRACNFYYGENSIKLVNKKKSIPLNGNKKISFDQIELISRNSIEIIPLSKINNLDKLLKKQIISDLNNIKSKKKKFCKIKFFKDTKYNGCIKSYSRQLF